MAVASLSCLTAATPRVAAVSVAPPRDTDNVTPAKSPEGAPSRKDATLTREAADILLAIAHRTADASQASALFAPKSWYTPPPPPPPPPPQSEVAPSAPPLPFALLGRYTDGSEATVYFVTRDDRVYDLKPGDAVDAIYTFESVDNGQLIFLYKPLNTRQSLPIGDAP